MSNETKPVRTVEPFSNKELKEWKELIVRSRDHQNRFLKDHPDLYPIPEYEDQERFLATIDALIADKERLVISVRFAVEILEDFLPIFKKSKGLPMAIKALKDDLRTVGEGGE